MAECPKWLRDWQKDAERRVEALRHKWRRERERLDLEIEEDPIESNFTDELVELMHREEALGAAGDLAGRETLAQRIDKMLAAQTFQHFNAQADANGRRLGALFRQQTTEFERFLAQLDTQLAAVCRSAQLPPDPPPLAELAAATAVAAKVQAEAEARAQTGSQRHGPELGGVSLAAFAREERRLWAVAQRDMGASERLHLEAAFGLQLRRVDEEWAAHEEQMRLDYEAQRSSLEGRHVEKQVVQSPVGPWKSKEKQSLLIHTAPVHTPSSPTLRAGAAGAGGGGSKNAAARGGGGAEEDHTQSLQQQQQQGEQLRQLEAAYRDARDRVQYQKQNAVRWIKRQSERMEIQIAAMARDKALLGEHLELEEAALNACSLKLSAFVGLLLRRPECLPQHLAASSRNSGGGQSSRSRGNSSNNNRRRNNNNSSSNSSNQTLGGGVGGGGGLPRAAGALGGSGAAHMCEVPSRAGQEKLPRVAQPPR